MLALDDPRWKTLKGGYKHPYDASVPLARLDLGEDVWDELWRELHHQGDVGEASYAAVPHLVRIVEHFEKRDWRFYALLSAIEIGRHKETNPNLPAWLKESYHAAWDHLPVLGGGDLESDCDASTVQSILAALALAKGCLKLGMLISELDDSEIEEMLSRHGG